MRKPKINEGIITRPYSEHQSGKLTKSNRIDNLRETSVKKTNNSMELLPDIDISLSHSKKIENNFKKALLSQQKS